MHPIRAAAASCVALLSIAAGQAAAEPIYGLTDTQFFPSSLVKFDSATPGTMTFGAISGLVGGQTLRAIDFRPANGLLYALSTLGTAAQLYTVNLATAVLTPVGSGFQLTGNGSTEVSIDFNPVVDRLRVVTGTGQNYRVNPINGTLVQADTSLPAQNTGTEITSIAYSNNVVGAASTTLYAYNFGTDQLDTIGNVGGSVSPNTGQVNVVGDTNLLSASPNIGLDISGLTGIAYASVYDQSGNAAYGFYTVNLATGAHTLVGTEAFALLDIAATVAPVVTVVPEPGMLAALGLGAAVLARARRRRSTRSV